MTMGRVMLGVCGVLIGATAVARQAPPAAFMPFADVRPIVLNLREALWPEALRGLSPEALEAAWPRWAGERDRAVRERVAAGDEDAIINLLQFGTSFTRQPRITEERLAGVALRAAGSQATRFVPSPLLEARIDDFIRAVASPGSDERLLVARRVLDRQGLDPANEAGRARVRRYLEERTSVVGSAVHAPTLKDPNTGLADQLTIFRDRGLASDTLLWINFAIDRALADMAASGTLGAGTVRRAAIVGPGLDFADKQEGYDFYPLQTIQPFALVDSLTRTGLAPPSGVTVTAFDLSPAVLSHLDGARTRAGRGEAYTVTLPRNLGQPWAPDLVRYWEGFGARVGAPVPATTPPANAGRVTARSVAFPAAVVRNIRPSDLNIVVQRAADEPYDLIVATNILLYYDVFEQSLAAANIAAMLRPGGFLLSNDRIFELPDGPLASAGQTRATYLETPGGPRGDRIEWYRSRRER
jgi:hypothetical protein